MRASKGNSKFVPKKIVLDRNNVIIVKKGELVIGFFEVSDIETTAKKEAEK